MSKRMAYPLMAVAAVAALFLSAAPAAAGESATVVQPCTVRGTLGDDILRGTPGDDVVCGFAGDDIVIALGGDDVVRGGRGDDVLLGGAGRDDLYGGAGNDRLVDNRDAGTERGGAGTDLCVGVTGTDFSGCERQFVLPSMPEPR